MQIVALSVIVFLVLLVAVTILLSFRAAEKERKVRERRKSFKVVK